MSGTRYDIVFFTALWEERYFLVRYLLGNQPLCEGDTPLQLPNDPLFPKDDTLGMLQFNGLRVGVVTTEAMGGVLSAIKITQICEELLPQHVIVVGLCGAYLPEEDPPLQLGSVCVADSHEYHSFGKIRGPSKIFQMRELPSLTADEPAPALKKSFPSKVWLNRALAWQEASVVQDWLKWAGKQDDKSYSNQERVEHVVAKQATFISGEVVLSSRNYAAEIIRTKNLVKRPVVFEMEAYAIAHVCRQYGIPCITIKGVSDFADDPSDYSGATTPEQPSTATPALSSVGAEQRGGKGDKHRCAAIAAATSFALEYAFDAGFLKPKGKPKKPNGDEVEGCLWPQARVICPHNQVAKGLRKCIQPGGGFVVDPRRISWLSRIFDDVPPHDYSEGLAALPASVGDGSLLTAFFPYTAKALVDLLVTELLRREYSDERVITNKQLRELQKLLSKSTPAASQKKTESHEKLGPLTLACAQAARSLRLFKHFNAWDNSSRKTATTTEASLPPLAARPSLCRIIVFENAKELQEFGNDVLDCVYPALLGLNVKTFGVSATDIREAGGSIADVVFIERPSEGDAVESRVGGATCSCGNDLCSGDVVAVRFFLDAQTLIFTGGPCGELKSEKNREMTAESLMQLFDFWKKEHANHDKFVPLELNLPLWSHIVRRQVVSDMAIRSPGAQTHP